MQNRLALLDSIKNLALKVEALDHAADQARDALKGLITAYEYQYKDDPLAEFGDQGDGQSVWSAEGETGAKIMETTDGPQEVNELTSGIATLKHLTAEDAILTIDDQIANISNDLQNQFEADKMKERQKERSNEGLKVSQELRNLVDKLADTKPLPKTENESNLD
jgi:C-terminal processing protease CtpA/Prc